ncbi:hypothetical protein MRX96_014826 [Rhipicephalus microplus]
MAGDEVFHAFLQYTHRCVESLHLNDALIEGSGLGECQEFVISTLEKNASIRTLTIGSLFFDYMRAGTSCEGINTDPERTFVDIKRIVRPLVLRSELQAASTHGLPSKRLSVQLY